MRSARRRLPADARIAIAYSGLDSTVLLDAAVRTVPLAASRCTCITG
jgi:PP-loop superfamily ATP-utilizing enzyme